MFFYISARPVNYNGKRLLTPKYMIQDGFPGLITSWQCLASGTATDGRWVYEIEVATTEHRDVVLEGLAMWGAHLKTDVSVVELMNLLTGRNDITHDGTRLVVPVIEPEV